MRAIASTTLSLVVCFAASRSARAQGPAAASESPQQKQADEALKAKDYAKAAQLYSQVTKAEPKNGYAWYQLGLSQHQAGKFAEALPAYDTAWNLGYRVFGFQYNIACAQARLGKKDAAFATLEKTIAGGFPTVAGLKGDDDLASLHDDARWAPLLAKVDAAAHPCRDPKYQAFAFWIGEWDVKNPAGRPLGKSSVQKILDGCVLLENWTDGFGNQGKSFNYVDNNTGKWRQIWVDDKGTHTDYVGDVQGGQLVFFADGQSASGAKQRIRLTFTPVGGTVRQFFETSSDGEKTWQLGFDGLYVPRAAASPGGRN